MGNRDECASAEWSISRAYGSEACSVNATVLLRRDVATEDDEWKNRLGYVRLRLSGGVEGHLNELLLRPETLVALRDFMESPEASELVDWVLALCHAGPSSGHWDNARELLEQVQEGELYSPRGDADLEGDEEDEGESDGYDTALDVVEAGALPPVGRRGEWNERNYANATNESLVEHAHDNWDDDSILSKVNVQFMSEREPDSWAHLEDDVREIQKQLILLVRKQSTVSVDADDGRGVEWPAQALQSRSVALKADCYWYEHGVLSFMGYHVGESSALSAEQRRLILDYVIAEQIPKVNDPAYMAQWGDPGSGVRLRKMADSLATFARSAKLNKHADKSVAVFEWESDLAYLKRTYYRFGTKHLWRWPSTGRH
jgi:hypothetical protein